MTCSTGRPQRHPLPPPCRHMLARLPPAPPPPHLGWSIECFGSPPYLQFPSGCWPFVHFHLFLMVGFIECIFFGCIQPKPSARTVDAEAITLLLPGPTHIPPPSFAPPFLICESRAVGVTNSAQYPQPPMPYVMRPNGQSYPGPSIEMDPSVMHISWEGRTALFDIMQTDK